MALKQFLTDIFKKEGLDGEVVAEMSENNFQELIDMLGDSLNFG